jgi:hypothetical protein
MCSTSRRGWFGAVIVAVCALLTAGPTLSAQTPAAPGVAQTPGVVEPHDTGDLYNSLRDVINYGAELFNKQADHAGCYRVYQGALISSRPFLAPELRKKIDESIARAERLPVYSERAFELRRMLDEIRSKSTPHRALPVIASPPATRVEPAKADLPPSNPGIAPPRIEPPRTDLPKIIDTKGEEKKPQPPKTVTPPIDVPRIEVPTSTAPIVEEKKIEAPKTDLPKIEPPRSEEKKGQVPQVDLPRVDLPKIEAPKIDLPGVEPAKRDKKSDTPNVDLPKVELPNVELPRIEPPKAQAPKVEVSRAEPLPIEPPSIGSGEEKAGKGENEISGAVLLDGKPLPPGFFVTLVSAAGKKFSTTVQKEGTFRFMLGIPAGVYRVVIEPALGDAGKLAMIPPRYRNEATTPLKCQVEAGSKTFDLQLTK